MINSPVAVFVYRRVDLLRRTIDALKLNPESKDTILYIFSDAASMASDEKSVGDVRSYVGSIEGFKDVRIICHDTNLGLASNIEDGVSYVLQSHKTVIVLEDDILTAPTFLAYMNEALYLYQDNCTVAQICGYSFLEKLATEYALDDTYFVLGSDCLAWATWRRAWQDYTSDSQYLASRIATAKAVKSFNRGNSYNYFKMLRKNRTRRSRSWSINFYAVNFLLDRYTLYPKSSLALHVGVHTDATNYVSRGSHDILLVNLSYSPVKVERIPVSEKSRTSKAFNAYLKIAYGNLFVRALDWLRLKASFLN